MLLKNFPNQYQFVIKLTKRLPIYDWYSHVLKVSSLPTRLLTLTPVKNVGTSEVTLKHLWCSTNTVLNNYCGRMNDQIHEADSKSKKRKCESLDLNN